jgi:predicted PurR-regulated permease PerM
MTPQRWRLLFWATMLLIVLWMVWQSRHVLIPFAFGAILTYALTPVVDTLASVIPARSHRADVYRRGLVVLALYVLLGGVLVAIGALLVPRAVGQVNEFVDVFPSLMNGARERLEQWLVDYRQSVPQEIQERLDPLLEDWTNAAAAALAMWLRRSVSFVTESITLILGILVLPFWMFFTLRDRHFIAHNFMNAVPPALRRDVQHVLFISDRILARYIRGQLFLGLVVGVAVGVGLTLMGVQLSLVLGLWAGITELIPILGPWLGAIPGLAIVLATEPGLFLWVAALYVAVQQIENNLLVPRIQGHAVELHPAMIILLLAVGGAVFGFLGLVFIVPLTAILRELFWYSDRRLRGQSPPEALAAGQVGRALRREAEERQGPPAVRSPEVAGSADGVHGAATPSSEAARSGEVGSGS